MSATNSMFCAAEGLLASHDIHLSCLQSKADETRQELDLMVQAFLELGDLTAKMYADICILAEHADRFNHESSTPATTSPSPTPSPYAASTPSYEYPDYIPLEGEKITVIQQQMPCTATIADLHTHLFADEMDQRIREFQPNYSHY
jgi:hypothetical protein